MAYSNNFGHHAGAMIQRPIEESSSPNTVLFCEWIAGLRKKIIKGDLRHILTTDVDWNYGGEEA